MLSVLRDNVGLDPEHGEPTLEAGDRLVMRTSVAEFVGLRSGGATSDTSSSPAVETISRRSVRMMEGIVGPESSFVGRSVRDLDLRGMYGTSILAIHRRNENLHANFDEVRLAFGDTVLLEGPPDGLKRLFDRRQLINLTEVTEQPFRRDKAWIAIVAVVAVMALSAFEILPIAGAAFMAVAVVIVVGCLDAQEAYRSIHWPILMLILGMMAIGSAMETTGAGALVVDRLFEIVGPLGPVVVLSLVYALTSVLTEFMSHNASAILITPIAIDIAGKMGVDSRPFLVAVMFAASASFATPIGYADQYAGLRGRRLQVHGFRQGGAAAEPAAVGRGDGRPADLLPADRRGPALSGTPGLHRTGGRRQISPCVPIIARQHPQRRHQDPLRLLDPHRPAAPALPHRPLADRALQANARRGWPCLRSLPFPLLREELVATLGLK